MKKVTLTVLMVAFVSIFSFPFSSSSSGQNASMEDIPKAIISKLSALNLSNTLTAYEEEVYTSAKYAAFSKQAMKEGHDEIALLFKAISKSSEIHSKKHKAVLDKAGISITKVSPKFIIKTTKENLKEAIAHESHQIDKMYPQYIICAKQAQFQPCANNMCCAYLISKKHKALFEKALNAQEENSEDELSEVYFVCPNCGNTYEHTVHQVCQFCNLPFWKFIKISD